VKLPVKGFINAGTPTLAEAVELGDAFIRKVDVSGAKKVSDYIVCGFRRIIDW